MPLRVPECYKDVSPKDLRWVRAEDVFRWEQEGWKVNEEYGKDYGRYDMVLMLKEGSEPKTKKSTVAKS